MVISRGRPGCTGVAEGGTWTAVDGPTASGSHTSNRARGGRGECGPAIAGSCVTDRGKWGKHPARPGRCHFVCRPVGVQGDHCGRRRRTTSRQRCGGSYVAGRARWSCRIRIPAADHTWPAGRRGIVADTRACGRPGCTCVTAGRDQDSGGRPDRWWIARFRSCAGGDCGECGPTIAGSCVTNRASGERPPRVQAGVWSCVGLP